ncbi:MAG: 5-oxoprolinase subunit PxpA [Bacteroidales bacterium]
MSIDINCDIGESFGNYTIGNDSALMKYISSANIACGFHAGDFMTMRSTTLACLESEVSIGAHPGYPDLQGFGRRSVSYTPVEIYSMVLYQTGALKTIVESEGGRLHHVKPHGAMYNDAAADPEKARAIAEAVRRSGEDLILLCLYGSKMEEAAIQAGIPYASEAFADRHYDSTGRLVSRSVKDSVITIPSVCATRAVTMKEEKRVMTADGKFLMINPDSICVHGDTSGALEIVIAIFKALQEHNVSVEPFIGRRKK